MDRKTIKRKIILTILIIIPFILAKLVHINWSPKPLPEEKRNISTTNIRMLVDITDRASRSPIVRTYTKEEFEKFDEKQLRRIMNLVSGNVEGDAPTLRMEDEIGRIEISFEMIEKNDGFTVTGKIVPDDIPSIRILALSTLYSKEEPKIINGKLIENETQGKYLCEINRYFDIDEIYHSDNDDFTMESMFIEVSYEINNKAYVSIFAINTLEYKDRK
ncbi:MAG: hypothetical protein WC983_04140 [Tissierellaceae bacterium]